MTPSRDTGGPPWLEVVRLNVKAVRESHGPVEHYRLCRLLFNQSRRKAAASTWAAYRANIGVLR